MNSIKCIYCGADIKISKAGNEYCSNICWTKEPYKSDRDRDRLEYECTVEFNHGDYGNRDWEGGIKNE